MTDGRITVDLNGFAIETVVATLESQPGGGATALGQQQEPASPAYSRYWLHNRGPAPMGFLPVTVALTPGLARAGAGGRFEVTWVVASQYVDANVEVRSALDLPAGWSATTAAGTATLAPGGYARFRSWVEVPADAEPGPVRRRRPGHAGRRRTSPESRESASRRT